MAVERVDEDPPIVSFEEESRAWDGIDLTSSHAPLLNPHDARTEFQRNGRTIVVYGADTSKEGKPSKIFVRSKPDQVRRDVVQ